MDKFGLAIDMATLDRKQDHGVSRSDSFYRFKKAGDECDAGAETAWHGRHSAENLAKAMGNVESFLERVMPDGPVQIPEYLEGYRDGMARLFAKSAAAEESAELLERAFYNHYIVAMNLHVEGGRQGLDERYLLMAIDELVAGSVRRTIEINCGLEAYEAMAGLLNDGNPMDELEAGVTQMEAEKLKLTGLVELYRLHKREIELHGIRKETVRPFQDAAIRMVREGRTDAQGIELRDTMRLLRRGGRESDDDAR